MPLQSQVGRLHVRSSVLRPDSPKPFRIVGLGLVLGLLLGLGLAVVVEVLDPTVKDAEQLQNLLPYPVLARIPHLPSLHETAAP